MNFFWRVKAVLGTDIFSNSFTVAAITFWQWQPLLAKLSEVCNLLLPPLALLTGVVILAIKMQVLRGLRHPPRSGDDFE